MARTREPDIEFDPRHRIVGAIVLVTLAVILFPLILDERPNPEITYAGSGASSGNQEASPRSGDTVDDATAKPEKVIIKKLNVSQVASSKDSGDSTHSKPASSAKSDMQTHQAPKPVAKVDSKAANSSESHTRAAAAQPHWAVQVGTFSNQSNVRRLKKQLEQRGFTVMFKDIKLKQGNAVRVRVGPYSTRASANKAQGKIKQDIGIKGVVVAGP